MSRLDSEFCFHSPDGRGGGSEVTKKALAELVREAMKAGLSPEEAGIALSDEQIKAQLANASGIKKEDLAKIAKKLRNP